MCIFTGSSGDFALTWVSKSWVPSTSSSCYDDLGMQRLKTLSYVTLPSLCQARCEDSVTCQNLNCCQMQDFQDDLCCSSHQILAGED